MTCRHSVCIHDAVDAGPRTDGVADRYVARFRRCVYCEVVVPWPEPSDEKPVELEIWAAAFALGDVDFGVCDDGGKPCRACARCDGYDGFTHGDSADEEAVDDYAAGMLARQIFDGEVEP